MITHVNVVVTARHLLRVRPVDGVGVHVARLHVEVLEGEGDGATGGRADDPPTKVAVRVAVRVAGAADPAGGALQVAAAFYSIINQK